MQSQILAMCYLVAMADYHPGHHSSKVNVGSEPPCRWFACLLHISGYGSTDRPSALGERRGKGPSPKPVMGCRHCAPDAQWVGLWGKMSTKYSFQKFVVLYTCLVWEMLMLPFDAQAATSLTTLRVPDGNTSNQLCEYISFK